MLGLRNRLQTLRKYRVFTDLGSAIRFHRLLHFDRGHPLPGARVPVRLRALNGGIVYCRPGTTDAAVLLQVFNSKDVASAELTAPKKILDLGANIGLTMAQYAYRYPSARILGIELDPGNFESCCANIAPYGERCEVIWGAVWTNEGEVAYSGNTEWGFRVSEGAALHPTVRSHTMDTLIERLGAPVDYVKMDIEGAESALLEHPEKWIHGVRRMKIEIHSPYTAQACVRDLERFGFRCEIRHIVSTDYVFAVSPLP